MKVKVTLKEIKKRYNRVFLVDSQRYKIFKILEPDYCTYGVYGLNADYWDLGGILFTDGSRPSSTNRASDFPELISFFEQSNKELEAIDDYQARKIRAVTLSLEVYDIVQKL